MKKHWPWWLGEFIIQLPRLNLCICDKFYHALSHHVYTNIVKTIPGIDLSRFKPRKGISCCLLFDIAFQYRYISRPCGIFVLVRLLFPIFALYPDLDMRWYIGRYQRKGTLDCVHHPTLVQGCTLATMPQKTIYLWWWKRYYHCPCPVSTHVAFI